MSLRNQALSGFRWTAGARLTSQLITWSITLVVIRILSPADYGLLAMATVFVSLLAMFSELGLGAAVVQHKDLDERLVRRVFGVVLLVHLSLAVLLALSAPLIGMFYQEPRVVPVLRVLACQFVLAAFAVVPDALLQRRMEFRNRSLLDLGAAILTSVTTLGLAVAGAGVWALVAGSLLGQLCRTVGLNLISPYFKRPDFRLSGMRPLLRFGGQMTLSQLLWMAFSQADILICAKILGNEVLGFYTVAMHLASLPNQRISGLVNQVAFPAFSSMQHDPQRVGANLLLGARILSFVAFPILWGLSSVAPEVVAAVLGEKWVPAVGILQAIALIMPLRMIGNFVQVANQGIGRSDVILGNAVWALVIGPIGFFIGARWGGLQGLALAWLAVSPLVFLQVTLRGLPTLGLRWLALIRAMLPTVVATALMFAVVVLARHAVGDTLPLAVRLGGLIGVGAAAYLAATWMFNRRGLNEVLDLARGLRKAKG
ncbi:MAG: lipopolysaccharide biosynthesis protein [Comamonadaceae bacterium]|nr:lipopolysaccharide biosynthesis protein [Comamonadaceae bacterium]